MQSTPRAFGQLLQILRQSEKELDIQPLSNAEISVLISIVDCIDRYGVNPTLNQIKSSSHQKNIANSTLFKSLRDLIKLGLVHKNSSFDPPTYSLK